LTTTDTNTNVNYQYDDDLKQLMLKMREQCDQSEKFITKALSGYISFRHLKRVSLTSKNSTFNIPPSPFVNLDIKDGANSLHQQHALQLRSLFLMNESKSVNKDALNSHTKAGRKSVFNLYDNEVMNSPLKQHFNDSNLEFEPQPEFCNIELEMY
ncbi:hypothetical protein ROZALSC1DRAFT_25113, partial [Rozella allomycis CSF55]